MKKTLLALAAVACAIPALAFAASPKPDSSFVYCQNQNNCPISFQTNKSGGKITRLTMYDKCSEVPVGEKGFFPNVRVKDTGKFSKQGTIANVLGEQVDYEFHGKFKKPKKAVGEYRLTTKDCNDSSHDFVAKRTGAAE